MATSSTVTSTARQYTAANSEFHSIAHASQSGLNPGNTNFYGCGWFRFDSFVTLNCLFAKWKDNGTGGTCAYLLDYYNTGGKFRWSVSSSGAYNSGVTTVQSTTFGAASLNTWYFVEWYHDADNDVLGIAVNRGTTDTAAHSTGIYTSTATSVRISALESTYYNNGKVSSIGIFSRIPSTAERDALYNSGAGVFYKDLSDSIKTGLVSWWDLMETSGQAYDAVGSNNLTDNNTVTSAAGIITYTAEKSAQFTSANSEYLSITNASQSGLSPGNVDFSGFAWVKIDSTGASKAIMSKWSFTSPSLQREYLFGISATEKPFIQVSTTGSAGGATKAHTDSVTTSAYYFLRFYHDAANDLIGISINNDTFQTAAHAAGVYQGTGDFLIGSQDQGASLFMDGKIAVCGFISGIPTAAEWTSIYERGFGINNAAKPALSSATYVSIWELNEVSGTRSDSVGSNDLTDNNTVTQADGVVLYTAPVVGGSTKGGLCLLGVGL